MIVGLVILQQNSAGMGGTMMMGSWVLVSYLLVALGAIVLLTGVYMFASKRMKHHSWAGLLMICYGVIMLILGVAMIGQLFSFMMQGSMVSGITMIFLGLAMLYSGLDMSKGAKTEMM
jgi:uncharacterized membrane protein HdeD (DUF308 family)